MTPRKKALLISFVTVTAGLLIVVSGSKHVASAEIYIWKLENENLVKAMESHSQFDGVDVITEEETYSIVFKYAADSELAATNKIKTVLTFATRWGSDPRRQILFHPDDPDRPGEYIPTIEDAVKQTSKITSEYDWLHFFK